MIQIELFKNLREQGKTINELAEYFNVSTSTIKRFIKNNGLEKQKQDIDYETFINLYNQYKSDKEIAEVFKVGYTKIVKYRKSLNLLSQRDRLREEKKEKFLQLYKEGLDDSKIGRILGVNNITIKDWRESFNLESNFQYKRKFDTNKFMELYNSGKNYREISEILNVSDSTINEYAISLNLKPNTKVNKIVPTYEEEQIILGTLLGDATMRKTGKTDKSNAQISFAHSLKQENYCKWKETKLKRFVSSSNYHEEYDKRTNKIYSSYYVYLKASTYFTSIYDKFYKSDRVKYINKEILNKIDALGLAIWFMDDGYKETHGYKISTNCFSDQDLLIIKEFFISKFNIEINSHKDHTIYISAKYKDLFTNLIKPYIHSDCLYKLHMTTEKTPLNGETPEMDNPVLNP